ncbi:unnamed protein product [Mucor fragilis]
MVISAHVSAGRSFACPEADCDLSYTKKSSLNGHLRTVHHIEPPYNYECDRRDCLEDFTTIEALRGHQRNGHLRLNCGLCANSVVCVPHLDKHATESHGHGSCQCVREKCNESFMQMYHLFIHQTDDHDQISIYFLVMTI